MKRTVENGKLADGYDDEGLLEAVTRLRESYSDFRWESELWAAQGRRRSPYRALLLFGLSPRTRDWLLVDMCRRIFQQFPRVGSFLEGQRCGRLERMVRLGQRPFLESAAAVIEGNDRRVPDYREGLLQIRGVGGKVAECVLAYGYGGEGLPLDANVVRVFQRLCGPAGGRRGQEIERLREWLKSLYERNRSWMQARSVALIDLHELFRLHGQLVCKRTPLCERCPLTGCPFRLRVWDGSRGLIGAPGDFWEDWRQLLLEPLPAETALQSQV